MLEAEMLYEATIHKTIFSPRAARQNKSVAFFHEFNFRTSVLLLLFLELTDGIYLKICSVYYDNRKET